MRVYIVAAQRTPIGSFNGVFKNISASNLGAAAVKGIMAKSKLDPSSIDEVIVGNVVGAGQGMGIGRQVAIYAGIPESVPAYTLNMVCGSGMKAVMDASAHIKARDADLVIAAGTENMSQIPFSMPSNIRSGVKAGNFEMRDLLISDGLTDVFHQYHMAMTTENIVSKLGITRKQQDNYALLSQQKAIVAEQDKNFFDEIIPVEVKTREGKITIYKDEHPRTDVTIENLSKLNPAFLKQGTVTAGNSSGLNDGASAILVASELAVEKYKLNTMAEIESYAQVGIAPEIMGLGPVNAIMSALKKANLKLDDIDLFECNEAFAGQTLGVIQEVARVNNTSVESLMKKTNVNGGAIALGHPLGASGNRVIVTLLHEMHRRGAERGLATVCIGGGMGTAIILRKVR